MPGAIVNPNGGATLIVDNSGSNAGTPAALAPGGTANGDTFGVASTDVAKATRMKSPAHTVSQGTLIPAVLETAINSDLPGYVRAVVSSDIRSFDGSRVLVPRSSRLIGQYKSGVANGQTRAYVMWTRLIRPDGVSVALASPAVDESGQTGLTGKVDGHFMKRFGSALLLSVVGAASTISSGGSALVLSGGQNAASIATQQNGQIPPTIKVRQGQPIRVFTAKDLDFSTVAG
jgi:type IV secretion system protein VirB10